MKPEAIPATFVEKSPEMPPVSFLFLSSEHTKETESRVFEDDVKKADVYAMEGIGVTDEGKKLMQEIADGTKRADPEMENFMNSYERAQLELIRGSGKTVILFDISIDSNFFERFQSVLESEFRAVELFKCGDFEKSVEVYRKAIDEHALLELEREAHIKTELVEQTRRSIDERDQLKAILNRKGRPDVVVNLGAAHTQVYADLLKEGYNVKRKFTQMPFIFDYSAEALRRAMYGFQIPDEILALALFERVAGQAGIFVDDNAQWREVMKKQTVHDIANHSKYLASGGRIEDFFEE